MTAPSPAPVILVVDDDPAVLEMAGAMFHEFGCEVFEARNADDALRLLSAHAEIDLLFTDVRMPGMSGVELARHAQSMRPELDVVVTSAWLGGEAVGRMPFLPKPYRLRDIEAVALRRLDAAAAASCA